METLIRARRSFGRISMDGPPKPRHYGVEIDLRIEAKERETVRTIELETVNGRYFTVSICASIGTRCGGQCLDTVKERYPICHPNGADLPVVLRICELWERWHMSDLRAGTRLQQACLKAATAQFELIPKPADWPKYKTWRPWALGDDHHKWACHILKAAGLHEDRGYQYGSAWLLEPVPGEVLAELCDLFEVSSEGRAKLDLPKSFYRIDGGGKVEHLAEHNGDYGPLCGARASVGAWVSSAAEALSQRTEIPASVPVCKRCMRIAFGEN